MSVAELNPGARTTHRGWGPAILLIGFCLFAAAQTGLTIAPILVRGIPPWPVDAYMYMAKAKQVRDCFRQDCPALNTLRPQLTTPTNDSDLRTRRDRQYYRALYQYHLLHSFAVERLERLTGDWRVAYDAIAIVGGALMVLSIAAFIVVLFGPAAGGIGLTILSTAVFPGFHGIHWIVPSNMTLALGFLCWAFLLSRHRLSLPSLPAFALAMVTLHTVGQIYAATAVLIAGYVSVRRGAAPWLWIGLAVLVLAVNAAMPSLVERPSLSLLREALPADTRWWRAIADNAAASWEHASEFGAPYGGPAMLLFVTILGLLTVQGVRRTDATFVGLVLCGLCAAGALYVMPHYPAEVFRRVWIPFVVFAAGAIGAVVCCVVAGAGSILKDRKRHAKAVAGTIVLTALVIGGSAATALMSVPDLAARHIWLRRTANFAVDHGQPDRILQSVGQGAGVVYMHEMAMYLYFLYGGLNNETVFYPAVNGSPLAGVLNEDASKWPVTVAMHPSGFMLFTDGVWLPKTKDMVIDSGADQDWSAGAVRVRTTERPVEIEAIFEWPSGERRAQRFDLPADGFTWLDLPPAPGARRLILRHVGGGFSRLAGIRFDPDTATTWPWDRGVTVTPTPSEEIDETVVRFESQDLVPAECESRGVIDDRSGTIAVAMHCGEGPAE